MTDYVWYPVTGDGQSQGTQFLWHGAQTNWNTSGDWIQGSTLVFQNPSLFPGAVPGSGGGSGAGTSQGPGLDNVGLVAGDVTATALSVYQPNPSKGDPYIGSHVFSVDVLVNTGTVDIHNLLLSGFNQYALGETAQLPTLDVEGATFKIEGSIANSAVVLFPSISVPFAGTIGGSLAATGGGTIDIGNGGTVQVAGSVQPNVIINFNDGKSDVLGLAGVSASTPAAFAGTISNFASGDAIFLPALTSPVSDTPTFNNGTLTISNGTTTLATLPMSGTFTSSSFSLVSANGGTDVILGSGSPNLVSTLTTSQQLELVYVAYFNRSADGPGFAFWNGQNVTAQNGGQSSEVALSNIANSFAPQSETETLYPSLDPYVGVPNPPPLNTPAGQAALNTFISAVYQNMFNRPADSAGANYWIGQITNGFVGLGAAALAIAGGATNADAIALQNKVAVALDFTNNTTAAGLSSSTPLVTAARSVLSGVDNVSLNDASVAAGKAATQTFIAATPVITAVNWNNATQTVQILGNKFGSQAPYTGDSQFIELFQPQNLFSAGYSGPDIHDTAGLTVTNWTNNEIDVHGFTGTYGTAANLSFIPGDSVTVSVANPAQSAPLFTTFPASLTITVPAATTASAQAAAASNALDPTIITITDSHQVIDPGTGNHTIQFLSGASADTLVLHAAGEEQVSGFDPGPDVLDVRALLAAANVDVTGGVAGLQNYLSAADQGNDAAINFDPTGHGGGSTIAVLQGLGGSVSGLGDLVTKGELRFT